MATQTTRAADTYSPLYFLASPGAGGVTVSFFMFLMFWVPHPGRPVPIFEDILAAFTAGAVPMQTGIIIAVLGIAYFAYLNLKLLFWNISAFSTFAKTDAYQNLITSNAESTVLAMPLAMAMTVNGLFIVGLVFVPGLWGVVEYLFPLALIAFALIGLLAFQQIGRFLGRVLSKGGVFDVTAHNSFAQLLPAFAVSMVPICAMAWSRIDKPSRTEPSAALATMCSASASASTPSFSQIDAKCASSSSTGMRRRSKRWVPAFSCAVTRIRAISGSMSSLVRTRTRCM